MADFVVDEREDVGADVGGEDQLGDEGDFEEELVCPGDLAELNCELVSHRGLLDEIGREQ